MKKLPLLSLAACVAAAWLYFTPYLALRELQAAAEAGDAQALNEVVDFAALRGSVKSEIQGAVSREISKDAGNPFAAIGSAVTGMLVDPVVNAAVTPEGISLMMKGRRPTDDSDEKKDGDENWRDDVKIDRGWEGTDRFVVQYRDAKTGDEQVALVMRREGLRWRLSGVRFGGDR